MAGAAGLNSGARPRLASNKERLRASVPRTGKGKYPDSDVRFDHAPYFNFNDGKVKFDTNTVDNANENYGSASGVVPKSLIITKGTLRGVFCFLIYLELLDRIHPPSINVLL